MIYSILYAVLAALALGVLVFIHELGHYFIARREGMKIEAFSIGFGKPWLVWTREGVRWQLCWIPFGGYVKIAGMEKQGPLEPHQIKDGFYGKSPWSRIKVALAGPLANLFLAFILFSLIWICGGREKTFSEYTHLVGWVNPESGLYKTGVHPGDEVLSYGEKPFNGFQQMAYSSILDAGPQVITGTEINYFAGTKVPFSYTIDLGEKTKGLDKVSLTANLLSAANYLIYHEGPNGAFALSEDSPMKESGIQNLDRILWVDGELVFSKRQLVSVVNQKKALLTVSRSGTTFLTRIPRMQIRDLRLSENEKSELEDWRYHEGLTAPLSELYLVPYEITGSCVVSAPISYIDDFALEQKLFESGAALEIPLVAGDQILAVDGQKVASGQEFLSAIQKRKVQVIVQRGGDYSPISWNKADAVFMQNISFADMEKLSDSIGSSERLTNIGDLCLLNPVEPKPRFAFPLTYSLKDRLANAVASQKKQIEGIENPQERALALKMLEENQKQVMLGVALQDRPVYYNPSPFCLMGAAFQETWKTLHALVTGYLSPKYMSGPVGIVQVIHHGWSHGIKEALFWIAVISINLGLVNLLPIPVLDGGHICFSLYELVTGKRIKAKVMERMLIPFVVLLIAFFIYLTYQDLARLLSRFF